MAKSGKPSRKVLDWESLASAPNTNGAFSFLKTAAEVINIQDTPFRKLQAAQCTGPVKEDQAAMPALNTVPFSTFKAADSTAGDTDTGVYMDTVANMTTVSGSHEAFASNVAIDSLEENASPRKPRRDLKPLKCRIVQDAHTLGETVLYSVLWSTAEQKTPETKTLQLGWREMAKLRKGMGDKFCKRNVSGLIRKLAMECIRPENTYKREARTYRLHSFKNILLRRKAAGYEWVSRDKRRAFVQENGTPFADPQASEVAEDCVDSVHLQTTEEISLPSYSDTVVLNTPGTGVMKTIGTGVLKTPPLVRCLEIREEVLPTTTTEVDQIVEVLASEAGVADADAARRLISACRNACPTATVSEIVGIVEEKALAARSRRDVRNPIGFLLSTVPLVFDGPGIAMYRKRLSAAAEAARAREEHEQKERERWNAELTQDLERLRGELTNPGLSAERVLKLQARVREYEGYLTQNDAKI